MEIAFATKMLREMCENDVLAHKELGVEVASKLIARLADLRAVDSIDDLPTHIPEILLINDLECRKIVLTNSSAVIVSSNHRSRFENPEGNVNWTKVYRIRIEAIERF